MTAASSSDRLTLPLGLEVVEDSFFVVIRSTTMVIELEPAKPGFDRYWVTEGFDDFRKAGRQFFAAHRPCGENMGVILDTLHDAETDGLRRVWFICETCRQTLLVLGPPDGGEMKPLFPCVQ
jgi:hypothetical protein